MKKLLFLLIIGFIASSCTKDVVEKSIGDQVSGSYTVNSLTISGTTFTLPLVIGTESLAVDMEISKSTDTQVSLKLITTSVSNGQTTVDSEDSGIMDLVKNDNGEIELLENGSKLGFYKNDQLVFETIENGQSSKFTANRKK